jgi:hypothetical protein
MTIRVTCTGCHTRFNVSEKFAGKEGPCPKCKAMIRIPSKDEQVVIHAPENLGAVDSTGKPTLKPIARKETAFSAVQIVVICCCIAGFFAAAVLIRTASLEEKLLRVFMAIGAIAITVPVVLAGYSFLRDQERGAFVGQELWLRITVCSAIYAALWLMFVPFEYAFPDEMIGSVIALAAMIAVGGAAAMLALELDYWVGILHYGLYLCCCLLARVIILGWDQIIPGMQPAGEPTTAAARWIPYTQVELMANLITWMTCSASLIG